MYLLARWFVSALALLLAAYLVPGIEIAGFYSALVVALILGLINAIIRPVLIILTLPITLLTLGLFTLIINALLFWFVSLFVRGFTVHGFTAAFMGALVISVVSWIMNRFVFNKNRRRGPQTI